MSKRKFTWDSWNYDFDGDAYIIAKDQCPEIENVPDYICRVDYIDATCKKDMQVEEGWCKWQVRTDWEDGDGEPHGWYVIEKQKNPPEDMYGKKKRGWFHVWIVRKGYWY